MPLPVPDEAMSLRRRILPAVARTGVVVTLIGGWLAVAVPTHAATATSIITTLAGTGVAGGHGDGGPADEAQLNLPRDTDVAPDGSIYIADTYNNKIRKIRPDGTITTFAGTGVSGSSGDGGQARRATMRLPHDVVVDDASGIVYVADANNHRIRAITPDGLIRTVAGTGVGGYTGDGGPARLAQLRFPKGLALSGKYLLVSDSKNHAIRRIDRTTGVITTIAGSGVAGFRGDGGPATEALLNTPQRLAVDTAGMIYIADAENDRVRRVTPSGLISTIAGNGEILYNGDGIPARLASLDAPRGIAVDGRSTLYIGDSEHQRVRAVDLATGVITTVAGGSGKGFGGDGGPAGEALLLNPRGLTVDNAGHLLVADVYNSRIRIIRP